MAAKRTVRAWFLLLLIAVAPVSGENGRFIGMIAAGVSLRAASTRLATVAGDGRVPFLSAAQWMALSFNDKALLLARSIWMPPWKKPCTPSA